MASNPDQLKSFPEDVLKVALHTAEQGSDHHITRIIGAISVLTHVKGTTTYDDNELTIEDPKLGKAGSNDWAQLALNNLREKAHSLGGNTVLGMKLDYRYDGQNLHSFTTTGTVVVLRHN